MLNLPKALARSAATLVAAALLCPGSGHTSDFRKPWLRLDRALVIDAYEYNPIDWAALASDKRVVGFIAKASDGLPPPGSMPGRRPPRHRKTEWSSLGIANSAH